MQSRFPENFCVLESVIRKYFCCRCLIAYWGWTAKHRTV